MHEGEGDLEEVRSLTEEIEHLERVLNESKDGSDVAVSLQNVASSRCCSSKTPQEPPQNDLVDSKGYIRALLGLTGHSLTVSSLAWSERLVSGGHDAPRPIEKP